jgi:hypothetical protein
MAKYKLTESGVLDTETGAHIPNNEGNRHWREYQEWLAEGNTPDPADPPPPEPPPQPTIAELTARIEALEAHHP